MHRPPRASRDRGDRRSAASSRCRTGHTGISSESLQELLRHLLEGATHRCFGEFRQSGPLIAVPGQLRIEWDGPEARNAELTTVRRHEQRFDAVAVAAIVAAHVLN